MMARFARAIITMPREQKALITTSTKTSQKAGAKALALPIPGARHMNITTTTIVASYGSNGMDTSSTRMASKATSRSTVKNCQKQVLCDASHRIISQPLYVNKP
jgi:hypothetical protein